MSRKSNEHQTRDPITGISDREAVDKINRLRTSIGSGKIGRRDFMATAIALGLSTTAASSVFNKAWAMAKKGGRLRIGTTGGATSDVLDPGLILDSYMINVLFGQVRNNLTEVSSTGELVPELAESWDSTPDAKVVDVQDSPGRRVPQRQVDGFPGRRRLPPASSPRGLQVRGEGNSRRHRVGRGGRNARRHGHPEGRRRRLPVPDERLPSPDLSLQGRRHHRLGVGHRHRRLHPGRARAGHPYADEAQPELLEGGPGALRRSGNAADCRSERAAECPADERRRLHQQRGPEDRRAAEAGAGSPRPIRHRQQAAHPADADRHRAVRQQRCASRRQEHHQPGGVVREDHLRRTGKSGTTTPSVRPTSTGRPPTSCRSGSTIRTRPSTTSSRPAWTA